MVIKCKMCGGDLVLEEGNSIGTCEYCGSTMTVPSIDDEKLANLYNRANHFRMKSEFDKAAVSYENIIAEDENSAEAYWGLCLCKYGIEYVDDPVTEEKKPTCHRTQFTSILEDSDYLQAHEKADSVARRFYEREAQEIDRIQKQILEISSHEEPFDIFICYKESDENGNRTKDSVIAQDLYDALEDEGYKVFFARITLEDKLGTAYEPYIFAALNSAKVMIVVGTKPEHMNAVWVKNEWSRFLDMIRQGQKKMLIPAYRDMDPYDMPEQFVNLQAQDMSKIGFMQDLIRGIKKLTGKEKKKIEEKLVATDKMQESVIPTEGILRRAFLFLEDKEFEKAEEYFDKALDSNPEEARAYWGKVMVRCGVKDEKSLEECGTKIEDMPDYVKAIRFATEEQREKYTDISRKVNCFIKYGKLTKKLNNAVKFDEYISIAKEFLGMEKYGNSDGKVEEIVHILCKNNWPEKTTKELLAQLDLFILFLEKEGRKENKGRIQKLFEKKHQILLNRGKYRNEYFSMDEQVIERFKNQEIQIRDLYRKMQWWDIHSIDSAINSLNEIVVSFFDINKEIEQFQEIRALLKNVSDKIKEQERHIDDEIKQLEKQISFILSEKPKSEEMKYKCGSVMELGGGAGLICGFALVVFAVMRLLGVWFGVSIFQADWTAKGMGYSFFFALIGAGVAMFASPLVRYFDSSVQESESDKKARAAQVIKEKKKLEEQMADITSEKNIRRNAENILEGKIMPKPILEMKPSRIVWRYSSCYAVRLVSSDESGDLLFEGVEENTLPTLESAAMICCYERDIVQEAKFYLKGEGKIQVHCMNEVQKLEISENNRWDVWLLFI